MTDTSRRRLAPVLLAWDRLSRSRPGLAVLVILGCLALTTPGSAQQFPPPEDLRTMLRYMVEDGEAPAVVLGVLEPDGSTAIVHYGDAGEGARPLGPRSVFELGPVTMTFTATLLAEMVARGDVAFDDPVTRYLPDDVPVPAVGERPVTLEHLARHYSGLPAEPPEPYDEFTTEDLYAFLRDFDPRYAAGAEREFSVLGYGLLGHALARAAGTDYEALLRERVLEPLGMDETGYGTDGVVGDQMARGHARGEAVEPERPAPALHGAIGLRSSAEDLLAYVKAHASPPRTALQRAMRRTHQVQHGDDIGEGNAMAWRVYSQAKQPLLVSHGGRTDGFTALLTFDVDRGIGTVVLANTGEFNDWTARDLLYPEPPPRQRVVEVAPEVLTRWTGTYDGTVGRYQADLRRGQYYIRLDDQGFLTYQPRGQIRMRLYPDSDSTFFMMRGPWRVRFADTGEDVRLTVEVDEREPGVAGRSWHAWKVSDDTPPPTVVAGNAEPWAGWGTGTWTLLALLGAGALAAITRRILWRSRRA